MRLLFNLAFLAQALPIDKKSCVLGIIQSWPSFSSVLQLIVEYISSDWVVSLDRLTIYDQHTQVYMQEEQDYIWSMV